MSFVLAYPHVDGRPRLVNLAGAAGFDASRPRLVVLTRPAGRAALRGMGVTYYSDDKPDAATIAQIQAAGGAVNYIERPKEEAEERETAAPPQYDFNFVNTVENCPLGDNPCIDRRIAAVSAMQEQHVLENAQYQADLARQNWEVTAARNKELGIPPPPPPNTVEFYLQPHGGYVQQPAAPTVPPIRQSTSTPAPAPGAPVSLVLYPLQVAELPRFKAHVIDQVKGLPPAAWYAIGIAAAALFFFGRSR